MVRVNLVVVVCRMFMFFYVFNVVFNLVVLEVIRVVWIVFFKGKDCFEVSLIEIEVINGVVLVLIGIC